MRVLVTGGTGVIGAGVIPELIRRAHAVRVLSRHAEEDAKKWNRVEPFAGNVAEASSLRGAAGGCDAVVHIAEADKGNVEGARNIVAEANRAGTRRLIYVSAPQRVAEEIVTNSDMNWTIVRPGVAYGPGDEVISAILKMVRTSPAIPEIKDGDRPFQPVWFEDLGCAIVKLLEDDSASRHTFDVAGCERTSRNDLIRRFGEITGRKPIRLPVPMSLISIDAKTVPRNVLADLGIAEMSLDRGLRILADSVPEQLAEDGVGSMQKKKFWADISGSRMPDVALMSYFRDHVNDVMPIEFAAEPGAPERAELGATMTAHLPVRGNIQIRVERSDPTRIVFATVEGHPIAGIVEFTTQDLPGARVRFAIEVSARAANIFDFVALHTIGDPAQSANWRTVVQRMVDASGGTSDGVQHEVRTLDAEESAQVEKNIRAMIQSRKRGESATPERPA